MPVSRLATITEAPDSGVDTAFSHTVDSGATLLLVSFHCNAGFDYSGTATWSLGGGENLTELWNSPGVSFGDARCTVFGLVSPTSGAGTITIPHGSISETIGTGVNYDGTIISDLNKKEGMELPVLYWRPSTAVCGLDFYRGNLFERWQNDLIVGALKYEEVRILDMEENRVLHQEVILKNHGRVRDVACGPDGAIYVVLNKPGKVLRLTPVLDGEE